MWFGILSELALKERDWILQVSSCAGSFARSAFLFLSLLFLQFRQYFWYRTSPLYA